MTASNCNCKDPVLRGLVNCRCFKPKASRPIVIIESPYAGDLETNVAYARECLRHSIMLGEVPLASHLLYTQPGVLRDEVPEERQLGIELGLEIRRIATKTVVYEDLGISSGMYYGIMDATKHGRPIEYRRIRS